MPTCSRRGKRDGERGAGADLARDVDLSAECLDIVLDDREPQARPAVLARARLVYSVESLEDVFLMHWGNPRALIDHLHHPAVGRLAHRDADGCPTVAVLDCVVHQVEKNLADTYRVGLDNVGDPVVEMI